METGKWYSIEHMLTSEQYEAVGRLAVAFNDIEFMIEVYIANVLDTPEWKQSVFLAEREFGFAKKRTLLKNLLEIAEAEYPLLKPHIETVNLLLSKAAEIASKRNEHVHGLAVTDNISKEVVRRYKGIEKPCDADAIKALASEASKLAEQLNLACLEVVMRLVRARDLKRAESDDADSP